MSLTDKYILPIAEWLGEKGTQITKRIKRADGSPLAMVALWIESSALMILATLFLFAVGGAFLIDFVIITVCFLFVILVNSARVLSANWAGRVIIALAALLAILLLVR